MDDTTQASTPFGYDICSLNETATPLSSEAKPQQFKLANAGEGCPPGVHREDHAEHVDHKTMMGWRMPGGEFSGAGLNSATVGALTLSCNDAMEQEEANPSSLSRDITPAASTRSSHNWKKTTPNSPSEPLFRELTDSRNSAASGCLPVPISCSPDPVDPIGLCDPSGGVWGATPQGVCREGGQRGERVKTRRDSAPSMLSSYQRGPREGPAQIREIPPLDRTPLWTHHAGSISADSAAGKQTTSGRSPPIERSNSCSSADVFRKMPSWDIPETPVHEWSRLVCTKQQTASRDHNPSEF